MEHLEIIKRENKNLQRAYISVTHVNKVGDVDNIGHKLYDLCILLGKILEQNKKLSFFFGYSFGHYMFITYLFLCVQRKSLI